MTTDKNLMLEMYRRMQRIRQFEEAVRGLYRRGLMRGLAHDCIGQEAVPVGACLALREDDYITSTHRGHGHVIAKGGRTDRMMAEILGKETGYNRGKGGTMHIADCSIGVLGANGIVGGGFGIATGAGLSAKLQGSDRVSLCFFGDGAANQGLLYECFNLSAIWNLPVIFLCENNLYGEYTAIGSVAGGDTLGARAAAFNIPTTVLDGQFVEAVYSAVKPAVQRARAREGPWFFEARTYRYHGHHVGDPGTSYRSAAEIASWKERDPIRLLERRLEGLEIPESALSDIREEIRSEIESAVTAAEAADFPSNDEVSHDVYA
ncbi:MAG: thiamine pyrophosphate-dependent dehydrogenase E1 component subunit alpha [Anaerolineae bacterium]